MAPEDTDSSGEAPEPSRTGAQAVERAMAILRCFEDEDDDLGISEIAKRTGLRVSTAHRIVRALCGGGLMDQDRRSDRYRLGRTLVLLGQRAASQLGLESARPVLERLAQATGESASLGTRHDDELVVVLVASSAQRLRFDHEQGGRIGMHASAMGKAVLANATRDVARAVPDGLVLDRYTDFTITDRDELLADLAATRERGYAVNDQGRFDGVIGIGAPLLGRDGLAHAAVGVQGPISRLTRDVVPQVAAEVCKAADELAGLPVFDRL
ncbi:MAG TPA: IclR family transcriptional regulator [Acidimicrobiales bacterium]